MAYIVGLKEKQLVLKEISKKLKALAPINAFLSAENPSGLYTISFGDHSCHLRCDDSEQIKGFVRSYKKELVEEIRSMAEKATIDFDEDEEALLN